MKRVKVRPSPIQNLRALEVIVMSGNLGTWCLVRQVRDEVDNSVDFDGNCKEPGLNPYES
jgi:hypothetical protein